MCARKARVVSPDEETTHIRVKRHAVQRLREAIVAGGGVFHGELGNEASVGIEKHAEDLLKKAKAAAASAESEY